MKKKPGPKTWIVGTLAPIAAIEEMLQSVLGPPEGGKPTRVSAAV